MFVTGIEEKYDSKLLQNRPIIEGNIIGLIWSNNDFINEHRIKIDEFITFDGRMYYQIAKTLYETGYTTLDDIAIITFLNDKAELKKWWETKGGFRPIQELINLINSENTEKYVDDFIKSNILLKLYDKGFRYTDEEIKKFESFNSEKLYKYYEFVFNGIFVNLQLKGVAPVKLLTKESMREFIEKCDKAENTGLSIGSSSARILNYHIGGGLQKGCVHLIGATSGEGKSSIIPPLIILPILQQNEKVLILVNEEEEEAWRERLLVSTVNTVTGYHRFTRQRLHQGNLNDEERNALEIASDWLDKYKDNFLFIRLTDYTVSTIKKIVHKYAGLNFTTVILDTMKPSDEGDESWKVFTNDSRELNLLAVNEGIRLVATIQLGISATTHVRYLNNNCIARARSIVETAGVVCMFRRLRADERDATNTKYYCKPYNFIKDEAGNWTDAKQYFELDDNKDYVAMFLVKSRYGQDKITILYQRNLATGTLKEIGFCTIVEDY